MQHYVPVVHKDGTPLMPCKPSKARKLIKSGAAVKKWTKTGIFYIRLTTDTSKHTQPLVLGLDPGANYDGICIASKKQMQMSGMLVVKNRIAKKMEQRRNMRRARRWRNCRRRPKRFSNRTRKEGWLPPSIKAKVDMRIGLIKSLLSIYPVTEFAVEDIRIVFGVVVGTTLVGVFAGGMFRQQYLKTTASRALLLATPEPNKPLLTDLRAVVDDVGLLIKEYEHRTTKEIEGFEIRTAQLSALLAEAQSNGERLAAAMVQMQRVLGLKEGSEAGGSE